MIRAVLLDEAPLSTPLQLVSTSDDANVRRRLQSQGLRCGAIFSVVRRTAGGGLVVAVAGARVALGQRLTRALRVEVRA